MKFRFSGALLRFVNHRKEISVEGRTVGAALKELVAMHPELKPILFDTQGMVRRTFHLFLNGNPISAEDLNREVGTNDHVDVTMAIAGG